MAIIHSTQEEHTAIAGENAITRPRRKTAVIIGAAFLVAIIAFALRAVNLGTSFDVFIDEVTYLFVSQSVATNLHIQLYGQPFYLHPPAFFYLEAAYLRLIPPSTDLVHEVYSVRYLNVFFAGLSAGMLFLIGYRAMGWAAGLLAAWLFGLDTFIIRVNSLNLLETTAMAWIIAGYWVILSGMRADWETWPVFGLIRRWKNRDGRAPVEGFSEPVGTISTWRVILAGIFFGLALLTKETTAFLSLLPMAICFALQWAIPRRAALLISLVAVLTYAIYPLTVYFTGDWSVFSQQKFRGILRFIGVLRITGFNRAAGPSFAGTLVQRFDQYGTTYLLLGLGVIATLILLSSPKAMMRLIGVWVACAYLMMAYLILLGTLEEQFFFYLVVPSVLVCSIAAVVVYRSLVQTRASPSLYAPMILALILLFSGWNANQWIMVHFTPDNGYERVLTYLRKNVPGGERVASTSEIGQYLLGGYLSGPYGLWHTVDQLSRYHPRYLLVTPQAFTFNYGAQGQALLDWVRQNGNPVYTFQGQGNNQVWLYALRYSNGK